MVNHRLSFSCVFAIVLATRLELFSVQDQVVLVYRLSTIYCTAVIIGGGLADFRYWEA